MENNDRTRAERFYKGHETAPMPYRDGSINTDENEMFNLLAEYAQQEREKLISELEAAAIEVEEKEGGNIDHRRILNLIITQSTLK